MHVLTVTSEFPPRLVGGLGVVAYEQARRLARLPGFVVTVVTWGRRGARPRVRERRGLRVIRLPRRPPYWSGAGFAPRAALPWIAPLAAAPDVVYVHSPDGLGLARRFARQGIPVVYMCHSLLVEELRGGRSPRRRRQEELMALAHTIVVGSEEAARQLAHHYPGLAGRVAVVPPGVRLPAGAGVRRSRRRLVFVGRITRLKGVPVLLRAMARVVRRRPSLRLELAGRAPARRLRRLKRLARRLGVAQRVRFLGWLGRRGVRALYRRAAAVVVPSLSESFGLVAYEALAHAAPLIASHVGGLKDIPPTVAYKVPPGDAAALARAILRVLARPAEARARAARGRAWVRRYSWDESLRRLVRVLQAAARSAPPAARGAQPATRPAPPRAGEEVPP